VLAPDGNRIASKSDAVDADSNQPRELVELARHIEFTLQYRVDATSGAAFRIAVANVASLGSFAAVNHPAKIVSVRTLPKRRHDSFDFGNGRMRPPSLSKITARRIGRPSPACGARGFR
jgi:hypothetical protein